MHHYSFGGRDLALLADRAIFWPARHALIVADLHFEKASWFAATGQYLPPFDSEATLARLTALVDRTGARELWCLGDSFHDAHGPGRLSGSAQAMLAALATTLRLVWITGNHDSAAAFAGESMNEAVIDGLVLRHEALAGEKRPELSGHFHPKIRVETAMRRISRPCFLHSGNHLVLPAYGALTGGLDVHDPALSHLDAGDAAAIVVTERALLRVPVSTKRVVRSNPRHSPQRF